MTIQGLISLFDPGLLAHRLRLLIGGVEVEYREIIEELISAEPEKNNWFLMRKGDGFEIKDYPEFQESFKMMTAEEFAGIECSLVHPLKLRDALWLLEEYTFFKI